MTEALIRFADAGLLLRPGAADSLAILTALAALRAWTLLMEPVFEAPTIVLFGMVNRSRREATFRRGADKLNVSVGRKGTLANR
jgi:hypothetical protein